MFWVTPGFNVKLFWLNERVELELFSTGTFKVAQLVIDSTEQITMAAEPGVSFP